MNPSMGKGHDRAARIKASYIPASTSELSRLEARVKDVFPANHKHVICLYGNRFLT